MAVIEGGTSAVLADVGAAAANPLHVTPKPTPYGTLGHYAITATTGTITAGQAANIQIFHARWTDATRLAIIYEVKLLMFRDITTAFAAGLAEFNLVFARSWTIDGAGGAALTIGSDNNQLRTSMGASLFGAIRISTTTLLTAGTSTLDAQDLGKVFCLTTATANAMFIPSGNSETSGGGPGVVLFERDPASEHPIVLVQNEGIAVRATVPATGTWAASVSMKWAEVTAY